MTATAVLGATSTDYFSSSSKQSFNDSSPGKKSIRSL